MDQKTEKEGWRSFIKQCLRVKSEKDLETFFRLFLTPKERQEIAGRYLIVKELLKGEKTQRVIAQEFQVSIANISRGSNVLKTTSAELKKFLEE
jgi:TrpR family trp operon transcriptional repressor